MVIFISLIWFGLRFLNSMSLIAPTRAEVVAWNLADFGALSLLSLGVFWTRLKAVNVFSIRTPNDRRGFFLLGAWLACCVFSFVLGLLRGNPLDYAIGDFYRYSCFAVALTLMYFSVNDGAGLQNLLRGFVAVYVLMVVVDLVRFNAYLHAEQERLTTETAHQAGMMAGAVLYLALFDHKRWVRRGCAGVLGLMMILLFRAQMITPMITVFLALGTYFLFNRKVAVLLGCGIAALALAAASYYFLKVAPPDASYLGAKLELAQGSLGPLESLEALSGVRLGELISIGEEFANHPSSLWFGTGAGSMISPNPIPDPTLPIDRYLEDKHYIHSGLFDALYHNGAIAVGMFFLLLFYLLRRGVRLCLAGMPFGQFVIVTLLVTFLMLAYDLPFESSFPLLGLCFAGVSIMETDSSFASAAAQACRGRACSRDLKLSLRSRGASQNQVAVP